MASMVPMMRTMAAAVLTLALAAGATVAQQPQPLPPAAGSPGAASQPRAKAPPAAAAPTAKAQASPPAAKAGGDSGLGRRVEQLEEQLVDMQVVIGTLESLAKTGGGGGGAAAPVRAQPQPAGGAYSSSDAARIDGLETQIRALTAQIEQLAEQVRAMDGRRSALPAQGGPVASAPASRFGTTTVTAGGEQVANSAQLPPVGQSAGQRPLPPAAAGEDPAGAKQLYETAYNHLLQQDYGAAEVGFEDFLRRYPRDALSPNAQYWLGEAFFVRGQYKQAAAAFLKGYQSYARSSKAPESLLKLAMSLDRLGQRDAACSSYAELTTRFPNAASQIRSRAQSERQRIGCA